MTTNNRPSNRNLIATLTRMVDAPTDRDEAKDTLSTLQSLEAGATDRNHRQLIRQAGIVLNRKWGV